MKEQNQHIDIFKIISPWALDGNDPYYISEKEISVALDNIAEESEFVVNINSPGGSVYSGKAIYNLLAKRRPKVKTMILGNGASAAAFVSQAGEKRIMAKNTEMFLHEVQSMAVGNKRDIRKEADATEKIEDSIIEIFAERAKISKDEIRKLFEETVYLTAEECLKYGFIDEIWEPPTPDAMTDAENLNNKLFMEMYRMNFKPLTELGQVDLSNYKNPSQRTQSMGRTQQLTTKINDFPTKNEETMAEEKQASAQMPATPDKNGGTNRTAENLLNERVNYLENERDNLKAEIQAMVDKENALLNDKKNLESQNVELATKNQHLNQKIQELEDLQVQTEVKNLLDRLNAEKKIAPSEITPDGTYIIKMNSNGHSLTVADLVNLKKRDEDLKLNSGASLFDLIAQQLNNREPLGGMNISIPAKPTSEAKNEMTWEQFKQLSTSEDDNYQVMAYITNYANDKKISFAEADAQLNQKIREEL